MITSESGKALIQTCLNSPDAGTSANATNNNNNINNLDAQRMNPTGFEEPELSYGISEDEQQKVKISKKYINTYMKINGCYFKQSF